MNRPWVNIVVPREDANDDTATLVRWLVDSGQQVQRGHPLALLETTKTIFEVVAPEEGLLTQRAQAGSEVRVGEVLGWVGEPDPGPTVENPSEPAPPPAGQHPQELSLAARQHLGQQPPPPLKGVITLRDLQAGSVQVQPHPGYRRVLLLGAGSVGLQALDILMHQQDVRVVGLLDDHPEAPRRDLFGYPLLGPLAQFESLWESQAFDQALITVGMNQSLRVRLYDRCRQLGIPLCNAIDPTARLNRQARLGSGNILCSFVHLGVDARLGDNNFVAAHSSLDHHNRIGDHNLFGPGCLLSGTVRVGSRCTFGSAVVVQPNLSIGDDCHLASGAVVLKDVPARHAVRVKLSQTVEPRHD